LKKNSIFALVVVALHIYSLFKLQYLLICLFIGEFYGQNNYNEYLIPNENQMQRLNYPMLDHGMVNTGNNFVFSLTKCILFPIKKYYLKT
jgi:hypothetical protein